MAAAFFFSFWYAVLWSFYEFLTIRGLLFMHRSEISPLSSHCLFHPHENWMACSTFFLSLLTSESYLRLLDHWCVKLLKKEKLGSLEEEQQKLKGAEAIKTTSEKPTWRIKSKISTTHSFYYFFHEILFKLLFRSCLEEKWSGSLIIPKKISESTFFSSNKWWFRKQHSVWKSTLNSL